ncbi:MAG: AAA family ATPase, partial [Actinomycetota bacterium]|nr:AAA family ATPase [Actinomycetota bacterium]
MTTCGSCGTENPASSRFCGACGSALGDRRCPSCGSPNPSTHGFCGQCGAALADGAGSAPRPAAVDERKLATVLFADVVGFTSLSERSDPEAVARTVDAAFRRLAMVVADHGGTVDKYMGDSLLAVFGVPSSHDDDAERAVAAGLAMRDVGGDLAFSIGINSGGVMVTSVGGGDVTVIGDTVNVAARLEKAAGPGEVLVGAVTAQLTGDRVSYRNRRPVVLKGKRDPVEVYEALALHDGGSHPDDASHPALVGRSDDLAFLRSLWQRTQRDGRARVVLVTGEAGVGTTRLVEELCEEVADEAHVVHASYPAYGAIGGPRVAAEVARQLGPLGDDEVDTRVRSAAGKVEPTLSQIDPATIRSEQTWAFRRLLEGKVAERPLLLMLDDVHRAGEKSLELIGELFLHTTDLPIMLVLIGRPEPASWLTHFPAATNLRLGPLGREDTLALAGTLVADLPLSDEASAFFVERSRGNALYVRELVALARERGQLVAEDGHYRLESTGAIPVTLQSLLAARLDALAPNQKLALQHVAVLGQDATAARVEELGIDDGAGALRSLVAVQLLDQHPDGRFEVSDPLLGEVAYETLTRQVRSERHQRAAEVSAGSEERARHLAAATSFRPDDDELRREAADAQAAAGKELIEALRQFDGVRLLRRAVELGHDEPPALLLLAEALAGMGRNDEAVAVLDPVPAGLDARLEARWVHLRAVATMFHQPAVAIEGFDDALRRWTELGDLSKQGWALANRGVAQFNLSRMDDASASLRASVVHFAEAGDRGGQLASQGFLGLIHPTDPAVPGWLTEGVRYAEEIGDRGRALGALVPLAWHLFFRSRLGDGPTTAEAEHHARRLADLAEELGNPALGEHGISLGANLARLAGRHDDAEVMAERGRRILAEGRLRETGLIEAALFSVEITTGGDCARIDPPEPHPSVDPALGMARMIVAESLALAGRSAEAVAYLDFDGSRPVLGSLDALPTGLGAGLALLLAGRPAEAQPWVETAVTAADALSATPSVAAARSILAEIRAQTGDPVGARELLATIEG